MNEYRFLYEKKEDVYPEYTLWGKPRFDVHCEFLASVSLNRDGKDPANQAAETASNAECNKRRLITKDDLYEDPDYFYYSFEPPDPFIGDKSAPGYEWSRQNFFRTEKVASMTSYPWGTQTRPKHSWRGGNQPITQGPAQNPTNMIRPAYRRAKKWKAPKKSKLNREYFHTNVLLHLLEFVRNDMEREVVFDCALISGERKTIHELVQHIEGNSEVIMNFDCIAQMDLVEDIHTHNNYVLGTQSEGVYPHRQLCLYKEAPEHVYLITPEDLQPDDKTQEPDSHHSEEDAETAETEPITTEKEEECSNPFLLSITRNLKVETPEPEEIKTEGDIKVEEVIVERQEIDVLSKIIEYFLEFLEHDVYKEFRFLGPFNLDEIERVDDFLRDMKGCIQNKCGSEVYEPILRCLADKSLELEMRDDSNDTTVIHKIKLPDKS